MKQILFFSVFLFFLGCNSKDNPFEISRIQSFPINDSLQLHSLELEKYLGYPTKIDCYDSIIAFLDTKEEHQIHLLSTNTNKIVKKIITKGQGPNELIGAWHLTAMNSRGEFFVHDIVTRHLMGVNMEKTLHSDEISFSKVHLKDDLSFGNCAELLDDSTFVMSGRYKDCRIIKFNTDGKIVEKIGATPDIVTRKKIDPVLSESYQGKIKLKPDGTKYALACKYADQIEIFDRDGILQERFIIGPMFSCPVYKTLSVGGHSAMAIDRSKTVEGYTSLTVTDNYIIGLFSGVSLFNRQSGDAMFLHVFDWNGNPIARYFLDKKCVSIDIDEDKNILYALSINPNIELFYSSLNLP